MKCEPSHRMVWYSTNHENRHFPTIPEAPQYPPRPHQPQNRIKSRGVVQPAANCRPPPPSPPQHGPKSPQSAIRRRISFRRPKPGDCEFGARKGRAERSRCPINTPAMHPGKREVQTIPKTKIQANIHIIIGFPFQIRICNLGHLNTGLLQVTTTNGA